MVGWRGGGGVQNEEPHKEVLRKKTPQFQYGLPPTIRWGRKFAMNIVRSPAVQFSAMQIWESGAWASGRRVPRTYQFSKSRISFKRVVSSRNCRRLPRVPRVPHGIVEKRTKLRRYSFGGATAKFRVPGLEELYRLPRVPRVPHGIVEKRTKLRRYSFGGATTKFRVHRT